MGDTLERLVRFGELGKVAPLSGESTQHDLALHRLDLGADDGHNRARWCVDRDPHRAELHGLHAATCRDGAVASEARMSAPTAMTAAISTAPPQIKAQNSPA